MAKSGFKKASTKVIYKGKAVAVVRLTMPPKSTTGRHIEARPYVVVPLTPGTLDRQTFRSVRGNLAIQKDKIRLRPHLAYVRKTGKGVDHELCNNGDETVILFKMYP